VAILAAFAIATLVDDDGALFPWHMLLGAVAAFLVVLRVAWGVRRLRYARFGSFAFGPSSVVAYVKGIFTGRGERHVGHNPGSSVAIFAMLALTVGLAITGVAMSGGDGVAKELHEVFAYSLIGVVGVHVAGVVVHTLRRRENISLSMVDGRKAVEPAQAISSSHPLVALALLGLTAVWSATLVRGYDPATRSVGLPGLGARIALGEAEGAEGAGEPTRGGPGNKHDDDD
jgi:cytochrome b